MVDREVVFATFASRCVRESEPVEAREPEPAERSGPLEACFFAAIVGFLKIKQLAPLLIARKGVSDAYRWP
jgi:hypothetical protein